MSEESGAANAGTSPPVATSSHVAAPKDAIDVFLCHNSKDKPLVRQVADGLELEFGIPHFLDAYAIPTGAAFLPWIDDALAKSGGCLVFLGEQGWGDTHFWEAERALDRYRKDPRFRLIPVALPGIRDEDMARLGSGSVFSQLNWAEFRSGPVDPDAISKLRATLLGSPPEHGKGPPRLTPYLIRRDAARWEDSKRKDKSILYRGRQLAQAEALRTTQSDLVAGEAIVSFLAASATHQRRSAFWVAGFSIVAAVAIAGLGLGAEFSRRLALSRFIAAEARQAASPDTGLLLAVQATTVSDSAEGFGALLERLDAQPYLRNMLRVGATEVLSLAFSKDSTKLFAGLADGSVARIDLRTMEAEQVAWQLPASVTALALDDEASQAWAGTQDGRLFVLEPAGVKREVLGFVSAQPATSGGVATVETPFPILSLQVDPDRRWIAVGDHDHRLRLVDRSSGAVLWTRSAAAQRITSISFSADGKLLAAANSDGLVDVFVAGTGTPAWTISTARTGAPRAIQFARNGELRVVDDGLQYSVFAPNGSVRAATKLQGSDGLSAAATGPKREFGPINRRDFFIMGFDTGDVSLTPVASDADAIRIRAHARTVDSAVLADDGRLAATASSDGVIAVWDLQQRSRLLARHEGPDGDVIALAYDDANRLVAITTSEKTAEIAVESEAGWRSVTDLAHLSRQGAGQGAVNLHPNRPDEAGFVALPDKVLTHAAFSVDARSVTWVTRGGAVFWAPLTAVKPTVLLKPTGEAIEALAISESGHFVFAVGENGTLMQMNTEQPTLSPVRFHLPAPIRSLVATNDENGVVVVLDDRSIRRIEFVSGNAREVLHAQLPGTAGQLARLPGEDLYVVSGAGSSAGVEVGILSGDSYRRLHNRRVGGAVAAVAASRRASLIAAVDHSGNLQLWDLKTLVPMASVRVIDRPLNGIAISSDGQQLGLSSLDGPVFKLSLRRDQWQHAACDMVRRELSIGEWSALVPESRPKPTCADSLETDSSTVNRPSL